MACCPGADSCRLSAASRVASAAESCLPAVTPFPGPPDCPTPDRKAGHFGRLRTTLSGSIGSMTLPGLAFTSADLSFCPMGLPLLFLSQALIPNSLCEPHDFTSASASCEPSLRLCVPALQSAVGRAEVRGEVGVRDGAALEGGPECDECLLSRIKQPWGSPLLLCHCFLFLI